MVLIIITPSPKVDKYLPTNDGRPPLGRAKRAEASKEIIFSISSVFNGVFKICHYETSILFGIDNINDLVFSLIPFIFSRTIKNDGVTSKVIIVLKPKPEQIAIPNT